MLMIWADTRESKLHERTKPFQNTFCPRRKRGQNRNFRRRILFSNDLWFYVECENWVVRVMIGGIGIQCFVHPVWMYTTSVTALSWHEMMGMYVFLIVIVIETGLSVIACLSQAVPSLMFDLWWWSKHSSCVFNLWMDWDKEPVF